ncbi:hypothetical protein I9018_10115 [Pseudomonas sp. MPFS]|uniref:hypothetical protein n=1 Tax=Pseudomonas sp. MPFS TaxID=2795724 RepID=UPI001F12FC91|nr:hypothetical protein [Pseudomonas sp. MPFS]UMZ14030.1 hypothetical protein I9018_10115 [Pseudomonas sp. MPFS]
MQAQHMIMLAGALLSGLALAYFIRRAFLRALASATADYRDRNHALSNDLARTVERCQLLAAQAAEHQAQQQQLKAQPFTVDDQQTLIRMAQALELATKTFKALKAEDAHAKAASLIPQARELAYRVFHTATASAALNADSLDTRLIEWLNNHGSFWAELETSTVTFPHEADTEGYPHLREALRDAYEQHQQREAGELAEEAA